MARCLALDLGERRIGVAVSDSLGMFASPLSVLERESRQQDHARIGELVRGQCAGVLVIGHPLNDDDSAGPQARYVEGYALALEGALRESGLDVTIVLWDEHGSTQRAQQAMIATGRDARQRKARIDAVAAAVILQDYLDAQWPRHEPEPGLGAQEG